MQLGMISIIVRGAWERMVRRLTQGGRGLQRARGGSDLASRASSAMRSLAGVLRRMK